MLKINLQLFGGRGSSSNLGPGGRNVEEELEQGGQPQEQGNTLPEELQGRVPYEDFMNYEDEELDEFMRDIYGDSSLIRSDEYDSTTQRVINAVGMHGAPEVVTPERLKELHDQYYGNSKAPEAMYLYRTVNDNPYMTGKEVADQIIYDPHNNIGGWGGQAYGGGMYFSNSFEGSRAYGRGSGVHTIGSILNPNKARLINESDLKAKFNNFKSRYPNAAKKFTGRYGGDSLSTSAMSVFAMKLGYNAITRTVIPYSGEQYVTVIDKSILITTDRSIDKKY